jgi:hypothetical protein
MLWGIAIADTRVPGYEKGSVEIARTQLSCRIDGKDVILNDDRARIRGGLYRRNPWFGSDEHEALPRQTTTANNKSAGERNPSIVLPVGTRADRVWHFWAGSPRQNLPAGHLQGCTVKVCARISRGALLQVGFDYWRNAIVDYGMGGNNHEAGASDWYFAAHQWQEAAFSDINH